MIALRRLTTFANSTKVFSTRYASSLIVVEHDGTAINPSTLACVTAANKIGGEISLFILGKNSTVVAESATKIKGISKVLVLNSDAFDRNIGENTAKAVAAVAKNYSHILAPATNNGKNFIPRLGALLDVAPISDVISVVNESTFKRPMYAGNAIATVQMSDSIKLLLIRSTAFEKADASGGSAAVEAVVPETASGLSSFVSENMSKSDRPELTAARVIVSGGRGMKSGENFGMLEKLADKLGGAVGASRAAVDAGYVPNELQIGQTGKVVAPELYIAVGISGAIQHLSGMKDSKTIVAINKDKDAPIFQVADYGIVDDLFKVIPEMQLKA